MDRAQEDPMTGPTSTRKPSSTDRPAEDRAGHSPDAHEQVAPGQAVPDGEVRELARTQDDVAQRARRLVAGELTTSGLDGEDEHRRADRLLDEARASMLADLRDQEQEHARRQLHEAARHGEDAVAGVVQSVTTIVRGIVPAALVRPEDVIEATFALADQGLQVGRRLAVTMSSSVRSPSTAA
jgi:hypothetical protein